jgi:hypothetical protein
MTPCDTIAEEHDAWMLAAAYIMTGTHFSAVTTEQQQAFTNEAYELMDRLLDAVDDFIAKGQPRETDPFEAFSQALIKMESLRMELYDPERFLRDSTRMALRMNIAAE